MLWGNPKMLADPPQRHTEELPARTSVGLSSLTS
jgi:hypothetical protein